MAHESVKQEVVLPFFALLGSPQFEFDDILSQLEPLFGEVQLQSERFPFTFTRYYEKEMGSPLEKQLFCGSRLLSIDCLPSLKHSTCDIETKYGVQTESGTCRTVNIDPGYLQFLRVVLASTKGVPHRIFLRDGIYAELTLLFEETGWTPCPWTYDDYRSKEALRFFGEARKLYKHLLR